MGQYLRSFVIGASLPVVAPYFIGLLLLDDKYKNFSNKAYQAYSIIAPLYFGLMNVLFLYFSKHFNWTLMERLLYAGIVSAIMVTTLVRLFNVYDYTPKEWTRYHVRHMITHILTFVVIIYLLEKYV